jgi:hypothetical protein
MKFKTLFLMFNAVVLFSFLLVFLSPLFVLGMSSFLLFWKANWLLGIAFIIILVGLNTFFALNWKLFSLLENEDWPGLSAYLGERIKSGKPYGEREIKLYLNTLLLLSDVSSIDLLEQQLKTTKPKLLEKKALFFGITRLLKNDYAQAESFLAPYVGKKGVNDADWLRFDYCFALALQKRWADAYQALRPLDGAKSPVLRALGGSFISLMYPQLPEADREQAQAESAKIKADLTKKVNKSRWDKEVRYAKEDIQGVILAKVIDEAGTWLFG